MTSLQGRNTGQSATGGSSQLNANPNNTYNSSANSNNAGARSGGGTLVPETGGVVNEQSDCHLNRVYASSQLRNRLEVIESIRADLQAENIEVPGVVVVGNQSAGTVFVGLVPGGGTNCVSDRSIDFHQCSNKSRLPMLK